MAQRLIDLHKMEKERDEMHSIREGHERLLEGLEGMTERATRYGNEANALHVALEASDAIVDEYEREVQVQEEVQGGLQLQLMSMTSQDQRHEEELHECRLRFLDMKRMYNQVHAHLAVLVHTSTDKMMLNTAPRDAFASHVSVENSVIKREQVAEAPHPHMNPTYSSMVRHIEGNAMARKPVDGSVDGVGGGAGGGGSGGSVVLNADGSVTMVSGGASRGVGGGSGGESGHGHNSTGTSAMDGPITNTMASSSYYSQASEGAFAEGSALSPNPSNRPRLAPGQEPTGFTGSSRRFDLPQTASLENSAMMRSQLSQQVRRRDQRCSYYYSQSIVVHYVLCVCVCVIFFRYPLQ